MTTPPETDPVDDLHKGRAADPLTLFMPLLKIDETRQEVYGVLAEEAPDKAGEIFDYASSKPNFQAWNEMFKAATEGAVGGPSFGNVREMHSPTAVGKFTSMEYDDASNRITVCAKIVDPLAWEKCRQGVFTGFSIGGRYAKRWADPASGLHRYTADPSEGSLVDNPCIPGARFLALKADGGQELRKFADPASPADAAAGPGDLAKADAAPVPEDAGNGEPVPVTALEAAVEAVADAAADDDPTVTVPVDTIQRLHNLVVGLGARCDGLYPRSAAAQAMETAMGYTAPPDPLAGNPLDYVLSELHATLVACGAQCVADPDADGDDGDDDADKAAPAGDLAKAGARHSAADVGRIQAMHDHAAALGATCPAPPAAPADSDADAGADKAAPAGDLTKAADPDSGAALPADHPVLAKALAIIEAQGTLLEQQAMERVAAATQITTLETRIAKLEAEPAPGGPILNEAGLHAVQKALGGTAGRSGGAAPDPIGLLKGWIANAADPATKQVLEDRLRVEQLLQQER